jgi:hypothetical protein
MIGWVLKLVGVCPHEHRLKKRDATGVLRLVCDACGDSVVALRRDESFVKSGAECGARHAIVGPKRVARAKTSESVRQFPRKAAR